MSAFGCACPHAVHDHEKNADIGARCTLCDCVITREQMLAFMQPPSAPPAADPGPNWPSTYAWVPEECFELAERRVVALERIAAALERLLPQQPGK
jgi:hypothetical protein